MAAPRGDCAVPALADRWRGVSRDRDGSWGDVEEHWRAEMLRAIYKVIVDVTSVVIGCLIHGLSRLNINVAAILNFLQTKSGVI